jgi:Malectin-like domain
MYLENRYPDDNHDRWWLNYTFNSAWRDISTSSTVDYSDPEFEVPSVVMQTAATTSSTLQPLSLHWSSNKSTRYYFILYFYEIQTPLTGRREFNIFVNGKKSFDEPTIPSMPQNWLWVSHWWSGDTDYNVSLVATSNSTLPPLLNAFEQYTVGPVSISTYANDGMFSDQ